MKECGQSWTLLTHVFGGIAREQTDEGLSVAARHICMAAVAENGITKSVTNLIKSLISNKLA